MWRGPWWVQSGGGPLAHAVWASVVPKTEEAPSPIRRGLQWSQNGGGPLAHAGGGGGGGPKTEEAPSPMRRGPRWPQNKGGPLAHVAGALVDPKRRRPPR